MTPPKADSSGAQDTPGGLYIERRLNRSPVYDGVGCVGLPIPSMDNSRYCLSGKDSAYEFYRKSLQWVDRDS